MADIQNSSYGCWGVVLSSLMLLLNKGYTQSAFKCAFSSVRGDLVC